ncbi:class I SAM-dependent methyltransferase [Paenibacillus sp. 1001270B_150601_E10]|uniref:class I SAM-dependent methyltransferase n=1 Tax=Paenibacillus sp. 1001270B_150601_E10 TaxID=2787079 RepID=UPI00189F6457|nr:class I SAM-dependent methyltransferase [Paenibacillus sp. 1001270B_150601_E10]
MEKDKQIRIFDKQAAQYDKRREDPLQRKWREKLISTAEGKVLEVAVGAGANFPYYPASVSVTATDFSEAMLTKARRAASAYRSDVSFICSDTEELAFEAHSFDTVISTLSMCSYPNPIKVLHNMRRWCKPGGRLLLMEHGISSKQAVSVIQKTLNPLLYRYTGCHHTRDVMGMMHEAGITIEREERYWLGMVHLIWARP